MVSESSHDPELVGLDVKSSRANECTPLIHSEPLQDLRWKFAPITCGLMIYNMITPGLKDIITLFAVQLGSKWGIGVAESAWRGNQMILWIRVLAAFDIGNDLICFKPCRSQSKLTHLISRSILEAL